jgi:hypothetical protein
MAQNLVITGKFLGAKETQLVGQNNYAIRSFYLDLTDNPDYPNTPEFQLKGDKVNLVDNLQKGQTIQVKFNIDGRKYDSTDRGGKKGVITNLTAWKIDVVQMQSAAVTPAPAAPRPAPAPQMAGPGQYSQQPVAAGFDHQGGDDDLPF